MQCNEAYIGCQLNFVILGLKMKLIVLISTLCFAASAYAVPGCIGIVAETEDGQLRLEPTAKLKQRLILIQNIAETKVWIALQPTEGEQTVSTGLNTQLDKANAAVLVEANQELMLACVQIKPGSEAYIDCSTAVKLCVFDKVDFGKLTPSTYWIAENAALDKALIMINTNGIRING